MKDVISVVTSASFGIWNIPNRGQNFINNHYAAIKDLEITHLAAEGLFFNSFSSLKSAVRNSRQPEVEVIFCSVLQLDTLTDDARQDFIHFFQDHRVHFALELMDGQGREYLEGAIAGLADFDARRIIDLSHIDTYQAYFRAFKDEMT